MPFRDVKGFDSETLRQMTQAFDAACARLELRPDDPERDELAKVIVGLASRGERDPAMVFARAIEALESDFEF